MKWIALVCFSVCALSFTASAEDAKAAAPKKEAPAPVEKLPPNTISIDNFTFSPQSLTVAPGTTVTWINRDDMPHTVKSTDANMPKFKSGTLDTDDKFTFTFTDEGTFKYFCTVHAHMTGEIIVKK